MKQLLILLALCATLQGLCQGRSQLAGSWEVKPADSTSKNRTEIEFQFKKNGDYIVFRSKGRLNTSTSKSTVNILETQSTLNFQMQNNGKIYAYRYRYQFQTGDILVLTSLDNAGDVLTLERKKS